MNQLNGGVPVLGGYHSARAGDVAEAESLVGRHFVRHRLVSVRGKLDLIHNIATVGGVTLHYIDYGAAISIRIQQSYEPYYLVQIPLRGSMGVTNGSSQLEAAAGTAVITEPGRATTVLDYSEHCARLMMKVPSLLLKNRQREFRIRTFDGQVFPEALLDLRSGPGYSWMELLSTTIADLDSGAGFSTRPQSHAFFERLLVDGLLLTRPTEVPSTRNVSRMIAQAMAFIGEHLSESITVEDIAAANYISVRALQERFRRELGMSPMAYLRDRRLDAIHEALQSGTPDKVASVAASLGITHMGRFASTYRERFGESPSETARGVKPAHRAG